MEKTETTIFVDWENLLSDLVAIQRLLNMDFIPPHFDYNNPEQLLALIRSFLEPEEELTRIYFYVSEPFTENDPRITGKDKKNLENFKTQFPQEYEKKLRNSSKRQTFNNEIAQQNQVKLRVGRVMVRFEYVFEDERVCGVEAKTSRLRLEFRQKQVDVLLAHDITKLCYTKLPGCILLFSKDTDFVPVIKTADDKDFKVFIANIKESPTLVPSDLKKSCDVRERSVAEIVAKLPKSQHTPKKKNYHSNEPFNNPFKDQLSKKN
ncbi:NYN domain-containing protein [Helicobacter pylori]|uniref:NYN domain-containing protein n=1 Tax=Helicobacter pylori TaxID=210 RepID=UPI000534FF43|nr:NYN domain-containing protein [Helicobacter pylori]